MRVVHVITRLENGGAEAILFRLATWPSDVEHRVISLRGPDWYSPMLAQQGVPVDYLGIETLGGALSGVRRLIQAIRASRADVVQAWMYRSNIVAGLSARVLRIPVVWSIHTSSLAPLSRGGRLWAYAGGALAGLVPDYVVNVSSRSAELHERLGYGRARVRVIRNGYDPETFFPDEGARARVRERLGVEADCFLIGTVARWHVQKDHPNLIAAMKILRDRGLDFRCLFVGPNMTRENSALVEALRNAGCEDRTICLGPRQDIADCMRAMDLHVLPSGGGEAFPNVVAEAMLCGTPAVVTDVGDSAYMVDTTGWSVPPKSPEALAVAIAEAHSEWKDRGTEWQSRRHAARTRVEQNFSLETMVDQYRQVWAAAAGERA